MFGKKKDKENGDRSPDEDLREELRRLQEQMENLRDRLETDEESTPRKKAPHPPPPPTPPMTEEMAEFGRQMGEYGRELGDYIKMVVNDAMRGADKAMRSIFIGPHGARIKINDSEVSLGDAATEVTKPVDPEKAQQLLSPLASAERIKILYLLAEEPHYHQDLMDKSGLAPGTLPHHLKQLEEAGYVTQERVRGRYLITIPGRMALKLAEYLNYQMKSGSEDELKDKGA